MNLLFVCSRNRLRSPTAQQVFAHEHGTDSAGTASDAEQVVEPEQLLWADIVFVMERKHQQRLQAQFSRFLKGKKVVCLQISDNYSYMQPELVEILKKKVSVHLR